MGRYESQRAIAARTISDPPARRKPGGADRWWAARRIAALVLTLGAIAAAAWLNQRLRRPAVPAVSPAPAAIVEMLAPKTADTLKAPVLEPQPVQAPRPRRPRAARAAPAPQADAPPDPFAGVEILSADELAGVSQAR